MVRRRNSWFTHQIVGLLITIFPHGAWPYSDAVGSQNLEETLIENLHCAQQWLFLERTGDILFSGTVFQMFRDR